MKEKAKGASIATAIAIGASFVAELVTALIPGVPTLPAGEILGTFVLTVWQAQGIVPDVPLGVPTYADLYGAVVGIADILGATLPVEVMVGLVVVFGVVINGKRSG